LSLSFVKLRNIDIILKHSGWNCDISINRS